MCFELRIPRDAFPPSVRSVLARGTTFTLFGIDGIGVLLSPDGTLLRLDHLESAF